MIKSFRHKGLQRFFQTGSLAGVSAQSAPRLRRMLDALDVASAPAQLDIPGWRLHALSGDRAATWSLTVTGNWRLTFIFEGQDVILLDLEDCH